MITRFLQFTMCVFRTLSIWLLLAAPGFANERLPEQVMFNAHIRPIMSQTCFACHGPDADANSSGFRLDSFAAATEKLSDGLQRGIVPGDTAASEVVRRINDTSDGEQMPPAEFLHQLTEYEKKLIERWIKQGAQYQKHWSYTPIQPVVVPDLNSKERGRVSNPIDAFIINRLRQHGLELSPPSDRRALLRRLSLDLTGLPPTPEQVDHFINNQAEDAYQQEVDRLLGSPHYGEQMATQWLDLVRFADSVGFHGDQNHNIYPYRDFVINSINCNQPFDEFTRDQLAGDLLPNPTPEQLAATGVLRLNMMTREGGGQPEEYLAKYTADRVRLIGTAWLGSTTGCCECHNHKFDPFTIEDFYSLGAFFDDIRQWGIYADYDYVPNDYTPNPELDGFGDHHPFPPEMRIESASTWAALLQREKQVERLAAELVSSSESAELHDWASKLRDWIAANPDGWKAAEITEHEASKNTRLEAQPDKSVVAIGKAQPGEELTVDLKVNSTLPLVAMRLEVLPDDRHQGHVGRANDGRFDLSIAKLLRVDMDRSKPAESISAETRFVRIELPGQQFLSLAEVEVLVEQQSGELKNVAIEGVARQSSEYPSGGANRAIDGNTDGEFKRSNSVTHTKKDLAAWWEVDLGAAHAIREIRVWNRTDGGLGNRLMGYRVVLLDANRNRIWETRPAQPAPMTRILPPETVDLSTDQQIEISWALADRKRPTEYKQSRIPGYLSDRWSSGPEVWQLPSNEAKLPHTAVYHFARPVTFEEEQVLRLTIRSANVGRFRMSFSPLVRNVAGKPVASDRLASALLSQLNEHEAKDSAIAAAWYLASTPKNEYPQPLIEALTQVAQLHSGYAMSMVTQSVPQEKRRFSRVLPRGDWQSTDGKRVRPRPPRFLAVSVSNSANSDEVDTSALDRLDLARWITSPGNPLTARHFVNYTWAKFFSIGLSARLEDLGNQGEWPSHPLLLDWLAREFIASRWDRKHIVRLIVTSQTYRQAAAVRNDPQDIDPYNRLLSHQSARRLSAEAIRDNALAVAGLLSTEYVGGPSVLPYQPESHWKILSPPRRGYRTSQGNEQYRRGIYMHWQRSFLHPMLTNFDAPARDECTAERPLSNSPQQALTLLNDPTFVEASVAFADLLLQRGESIEQRLRRAFLRTYARPPTKHELRMLGQFLDEQAQHFSIHIEEASELVNGVRYRIRSDASLAELAAWSQLCRAILNSHEAITKY